MSSSRNTSASALAASIESATGRVLGHRIDARTFLKRTISWAALWLGALFLIYSGWRTPSLICIAVFGLAGQWEFYHAQEEKGHRVFKQSGLVLGALVFFCTWYFPDRATRRARTSSISARNWCWCWRCWAR